MSEVFQFDREPDDDIERTIVNGFSQVETIDEIWVRYARPDAPDGIPAHLWNQSQSYQVCRIYLGFRVLDQAGRTKADNIESEFQMRMHFNEMEFKVMHISVGKVPVDIPSRIWKRPVAIWVPGAAQRG
jgi:hypothetical protein